MKGALAVATMGLIGAVAAPVTTAWPGGAWRAADREGALGGNLSGLTVAGPSSLWAVRDGPAELLRLDRTATGWVTAAGWGSGRALTYPDGKGGPDAEAVTTVAGDDAAVYVGAERDNDGGGSRNTVLRYDVTGTGALRATQAWELDGVLPETPGNTGLEGLAWVPDEALAQLGLRERDGGPYRPADHAGPGLFVVGLERTATLYALELADGGGVTLVATAPTGLDAVMEVSWSPERQELWALCDDACDGRAAVFAFGTGAFTPAAHVDPPNGMGGFNDEGFAVLPACIGGSTIAVWSDDGASNGHALREAPVRCTSVLTDAQAAPAPSTTAPSTTVGASPATTAARATTTVAPTAAPATTAPGTTTTTTAPADGGGSGPTVLVAALVAAAAVGGAGVILVGRRRRAG